MGLIFILPVELDEYAMNEFPCDTRPCELSKWILTIVSFWIQNPNYFVWYYFRDGMVISYNNIDSNTFSIAYWFDITRSTINRDNEGNIFFFKIIKKILLESIAIIDSMWELFPCFYTDFI